MLKTHFGPSLASGPVCGRGRRTTADTFSVTCGLCILRNAFQEAHQKAVLAKAAAFLLQTPRPFSEPWHPPYGSVPMVCKGCGGNQFRQGDRTCMGHYDNWHCANCGGIESRLTETGMSY